MKKIYLVLLLAVGFSMNSQVTFTPGIRGGLNLSNLTETNGSYKPDFYLGGFGAINFTKVYTLQPEINYSKQGANGVREETYDFNSGTYNYNDKDLTINYLSLSAMNKFTIAEKFQIMVGPTLDFIVGDNLAYRYSDGDLGINFGFGYKFSSGISVEARFKKGFLDILDSGYYDYGNDFLFGSWNSNNVFQFGVSYAFDLKKKQ